MVVLVVGRKNKHDWKAEMEAKDEGRGLENTKGGNQKDIVQHTVCVHAFLWATRVCNAAVLVGIQPRS